MCSLDLVCFIGECPRSARYVLHQPWEKRPLHIKDPRGENTCTKAVFVVTTERCKSYANRKMSLLTPTVIVEKYCCDSESRECMLNSCDECKHHGLTVGDVENGEANEDNSDSDSETNLVRYYQWKRGDDGYFTKLMVEADADEASGLWQSMVEMMKEHIYYKWRQI